MQVKKFLYNFSMKKQTPPSNVLTLLFGTPDSMEKQTPLATIVAETLKQIHEHKDIYTLAKESSVVAPTIYNIKKGSIPSVTTLLKLDSVLNAKKKEVEKPEEDEKS